MSLIPVVGPIWVLVEAGFFRGTIGPNRFGDDLTGDMQPEQLLSELAQDRIKPTRIVELDGTTCSDDQLAKLIGMSEIEELRLGATAITDVGLQHIRTLKNLRVLDLSMTGITDHGIEALLDLPRLTTIWLGGTKISDAGLLRLTRVTTLREVHVANTGVTSNGARKLMNALPTCRIFM
jgi:hypothetical protein